MKKLPTPVVVILAVAIIGLSTVVALNLHGEPAAVASGCPTASPGYLKGDLNGDGVINQKDADILEAYYGKQVYFPLFFRH